MNFLYIISNEYSLTYYFTTHRLFIEAFHQTHNLHLTNPKEIIENTMKQDAQTNQTKPTNRSHETQTNPQINQINPTAFGI